MSTSTLPKNANTPGKAEDLAVQLEAEVADILREDLGLHASDAAAKAMTIVNGMRRRWGGAEIYVPSPDNRSRDAAIRHEFRGPASLQALTRKYGLSERRIRQIVRVRPAQ